jgi:hypothetical protein
MSADIIQSELDIFNEVYADEYSQSEDVYQSDDDSFNSDVTEFMAEELDPIQSEEIDESLQQLNDDGEAHEAACKL